MDEALTASNLSTVGQPVFALFECEEIFFVMSVFESCSFPAKIVMIGDNFSTFFYLADCQEPGSALEPYTL